MFSISSSKCTPGLAAVFSKAYRLTTTMSMAGMPCSATAARWPAVVAAMQNAAMDFGMQRLDAPIQHFRESGELGNIFHGDAGVAQQLGSASGRNQFDAESGELAGKIHQPGFIGNAENGALNLRHETSEADERLEKKDFSRCIDSSSAGARSGLRRGRCPHLPSRAQLGGSRSLQRRIFAKRPQPSLCAPRTWFRATGY